MNFKVIMSPKKPRPDLSSQRGLAAAVAENEERTLKTMLYLDLFLFSELSVLADCCVTWADVQNTCTACPRISSWPRLHTYP